MIALVVAGVTPMLFFSAVDAEPGEVATQELRQRVQKVGKARVIVQLRLPSGSHVPEGRLSSPAAVSRQRADIASVQSRLMGRLNASSHRLFHRHQTVPLLTLEIGSSALAELTAASQDVEKISEDGLSAPAQAQTVPMSLPAGTGSFDGTGWMVAILDTGVDTTHPFIGRKVVEAACYSSTVKNTSTTLCPNGQEQQIGPGSGVNCLIDTCWHGTHVAGIVAGNGGGVPFSGVAPGADIMAIQVFSRFDNPTDCNGAAPCVLAWDSDLIAGLERVYALRDTHRFAAANLNLSGGGLSAGSCDGEPIKRIVDNLRSVGIATVVAAGNDRATGAMSFPACVSTTVSVGSISTSGELSGFSNLSPLTSLLAPGEAITSSVPHGVYAALNGTSMAAANVAGAWALLRQATPGASVDQVLAALQSTGLSVTDTRSGGRVATPSIQVAQALSTLGTAPLTAISRSGTPSDNKGMGNPASGITLTAAASATLTLAFNGTLRDRVGQGNLALGADGALDGTLTATLSAQGGRTITALRLDSNAPGTWTTNDPGFWVVGVATTLDGPLLNAPGSMAVNFPVANGGNFLLFASDYLSSEFLPGRTLTLTATFSDGSSASAVTTVSAAPLPATLTLAFNGTLRDRVGQGNLALGADGALDGTLTATLSAQGGRTITALRLDSNAPGT
ncbi:MAG TPA: S8 family serine peptidase, partial [Methylomirabilota bacterium]|nr:S8 family serine peptidase [Methylomirabilota bacterium]